jgi:hypothetical protein
MVFTVFTLFIANNAQAVSCSIDGSFQAIAQVNQLNSVAIQNENTTFCKDLSKVQNQADLEKLMRGEIDSQSRSIKDIPKDRHSISQKLNKCSPRKNSTTFVINFEGTGSFEPRPFHILEKIIQCPEASSVSPGLLKNAYYLSRKNVKSKLNRDTKWSGLQAGAMTEMLVDPDLRKKAQHFDFAHFPSEESELIADPEKIGIQQIRRIPHEMRKSSAGVPIGIQSAIKCVAEYYTKAKALNIKPKLVIMSHSSGGRSAVKFLEQLKNFTNPLTGRKDFQSDLTFTIDPVKEAHHAVEEVLSQYSGQVGNTLLDAIPFVEAPDRPAVNVWTRRQPQSLYKTSNTKKWVNVYQNTDTDGIKMSLPFGIHGSPIHNADTNQFISENLKSDAHGGICSHKKTLELLRKSLMEL